MEFNSFTLLVLHFTLFWWIINKKKADPVGIGLSEEGDDASIRRPLLI